MKKYKIAFHCLQFSERGTEIATFDYAHYNEVLLMNDSIIICPANVYGQGLSFEKFNSRFPVLSYKNIDDLENVLEKENVNIFYVLKAGYNDGIVSKKIKTVVHAVFRYFEPHGHCYAYVSEWLAKEVGKNKVEYLPHIVWLPLTNQDLREQLNLPADAMVFGRFGGEKTFDIAFVKQAIYKLALENNNVFFIFMNTESFVEKRQYFTKKWKNIYLAWLFFPKKSFKNILFLPPQTDALAKAKFINTCNAMIHARWEGETFGLACGEFSIMNKPVITCNHPKVKDRSHIEILAEKGIYYYNKESFIKIIKNFKVKQGFSYDAYSKKFSPDIVMQKFKKVFLEG